MIKRYRERERGGLEIVHSGSYGLVGDTYIKEYAHLTEIERKDALLVRLQNILLAVESKSHSIECNDVNSKNWFDEKDELLTHITQELKNE